MRKAGTILLLLGALFLVLGGCANARSGESYPQAMVSYDAAPGSPAQAPLDSFGGVQAQASGEADKNAAEATGTQPAAERRQIKSGYLNLEVPDLEQAKNSIRDYVLSAGGTIEESYDTRMTVRVPATDFETAFEHLFSFGTVLAEEVRSLDVTELYQDLEARLGLAEQTRERLYELLEQTRDLEERIDILREIRRLTEEIEGIRQQMVLIDRSVQFSRIDIDLSAALDTRPEQRWQIPFSWIRNLSPGSSSLGSLPRKTNLDLGRSFAVFENSRASGFQAESATGVRVFAGGTENHPKGDQAFWHKALLYHLGPLYAQVESIEYAGGLVGGRFRSFDFEPYVYEVLVQVDGDDLLVYEIYYPGVEEWEETVSSIRASFEEAQE